MATASSSICLCSHQPQAVSLCQVLIVFQNRQVRSQSFRQPLENVWHQMTKPASSLPREKQAAAGFVGFLCAELGRRATASTNPNCHLCSPPGNKTVLQDWQERCPFFGQPQRNWSTGHVDQLCLPGKKGKNERIFSFACSVLSQREELWCLPAQPPSPFLADCLTSKTSKTEASLLGRPLGNVGLLDT